MSSPLMSTTLCVAAAHFSLLALAAKRRREYEYRRHRFYLTRRTLPPYEYSAWRFVLESKDDAAFIHTLGFDIDTFRLLLEGFAPRWSRKRTVGDRRGRPALVRAVDALALTLQYFNSMTPPKGLQQIYAMPPATQCRALRKGMKVLLEVTARPQHVTSGPPSLSLIPLSSLYLSPCLLGSRGHV